MFRSIFRLWCCPKSTTSLRQVELSEHKEPGPPGNPTRGPNVLQNVALETKMKDETPMQTIDLARYTEPTSIWNALMTGHVRLVKMSWIIKWSKAGKILARRQELPPEAFISVEELKALYGDGNGDGVLPIIAISFCWLTPQHPDPEGKQLATIAAQLEREQTKYGKFFSEMGVFWDWPSLYQKDANGNRTTEEQEGFRFALHETMDLWYAHQGTTVYMLTRLPEGSTRKVGYSDSGWTTYERCSAEQIKKFYLFEAEWKLIIDLGAAQGDETKRNWPIGPNDFDVMIDGKIFTNGADKDAVKALFRKMSINQLGGIKMLDFDGMVPPSVQNARQLGGCLNLCQNLEKLDLTRVGMTDAASKAMFSTLAIGALASVTLLHLDNNQIGDAGMIKFSEACAGGALPQCEKLWLASNRIGDVGMKALSEALACGALANLQELTLNRNQIGDVGITAFANACAKGALPALNQLLLNRNQIGDEGIAALAKACTNGAMANLKDLYVYDKHLKNRKLKAACRKRNINLH